MTYDPIAYQLRKQAPIFTKNEKRAVTLISVLFLVGYVALKASAVFA